MNFSFTCLHLSNMMNNPFIQFPQFFQSSSFSLRSSQIIKSFNNFYQYTGNGNHIHTSFGKSSFFNFLMSPISITTLITTSNEVFSRTFKNSEKDDITIENCQFFNIVSESPGAAIHIESQSNEFTLTRCFFNVCRCKGKGGAVYALINHMDNTYNCFNLCKCGKQNGNDGSTMYVYSNIGIDSKYISANECPRHGDMCWYGMIILCNGKLKTENVNMSNSDVEFISGLAHFRPELDGSYLKYYTSINQIHGNSLAFIDMTFHGTHQYGALVNDSTTSGIFYVQNSTTTLMNYFFLDNTGPITYACVGHSKANFENCVFSSKKENLGIGYGQDIDCIFGAKSATTIAMDLYVTGACEGPPLSPINEKGKYKINIQNINEMSFPSYLFFIFVVGAFLIVFYVFVKKPCFKKFRFRKQAKNQYLV